jgi:pilus assembly protein CpaF
MHYLKDKFQNKRNIFISGRTSTGKTTLLNALIKEIDSQERIVIVEDTPEILVPPGKNAVCLASRKQHYESSEVSISDLIKASLRMRPDRIILGEIRREEVVPFIHALNTGHEGSICTGHSDSGEDMVNRLLMLLIEQGIPLEAARMQLKRSMDILVHLVRVDGTRRLRSIHEVDKLSEGITLRKVVEWDGLQQRYIW